MSDKTGRQIAPGGGIYYPAYNPETEMIGNVRVRWVIVPYTNHVYQHTLDKALQMDNLNSNGNVDIFLTESDYICKYTETEEVSKDAGQ